MNGVFCIPSDEGGEEEEEGEHEDEHHDEEEEGEDEEHDDEDEEQEEEEHHEDEEHEKRMTRNMHRKYPSGRHGGPEVGACQFGVWITENGKVHEKLIKE